MLVAQECVWWEALQNSPQLFLEGGTDPAHYSPPLELPPRTGPSEFFRKQHLPFVKCTRVQDLCEPSASLVAVTNGQ